MIVRKVGRRRRGIRSIGTVRPQTTTRVDKVNKHRVKLVPYPETMAAVIIDNAMEKVEDAERPKNAIADERNEHKLRKGKS
jgi:hypothetical protein